MPKLLLKSTINSEKKIQGEKELIQILPSCLVQKSAKASRLFQPGGHTVAWLMVQNVGIVLKQVLVIQSERICHL